MNFKKTAFMATIATIAFAPAAFAVNHDIKAGLVEILSLSAMKSPYLPRTLERGVPLTREPTKY